MVYIKKAFQNAPHKIRHVLHGGSFLVNNLAMTHYFLYALHSLPLNPAATS